MKVINIWEIWDIEMFCSLYFIGETKLIEKTYEKVASIAHCFNNEAMLIDYINRGCTI